MKTVQLHGDLKSSSFDLKKNIAIQCLKESSSLLDKPSPLDFDAFVPWVCLEWGCPVTVNVTRLIREESSKRRSSSKSAKNVKSRYEDDTKSASKIYTSQRLTLKDDIAVPVTAYYDNRGQLIEISIERCPNIHRQIIQAFSLCFPFHSLLHKLSIRNGGVTCFILNEISKLLPYCNLTSICLDGADVPEGNYQVLLKQTSQLKNLSLNRCRIDDLICEQLGEYIGMASCSLLTLEMGSNQITDKGAQAFGDVLRCNRHLLHLNLSGNMITDTGALALLNQLMEFPLKYDEIMAMRRRRYKYVERNFAAYNQCLKEVMGKKVSVLTNKRKLSSTKGVRKIKKSHSAEVLEERSQAIAESMSKEIIGEPSDSFNFENVIQRDKYYYCIGNMFLCSLNLAYNNLEYQSLTKITEVLKYQEHLKKPVGTTGLLRIAIFGNQIPEYCGDFVEIETMLNNAINNRIPMTWPPINKEIRQSKISVSK